MTDSVAALLVMLEPLCWPLHRAFEGAADLADQHLTETGLEDRGRFGWVRSHLTRAHAWEEMRKRLPAGWTLSDPHHNGQFELGYRGLRLRVLRHGPAGTVPAAGLNHARITYYLNHQLSLFGDAGSNLLALWTIDGDGQPYIRIVRTYGVWKQGQPELFDLDFALPDNPARLAGLRFTPAEEIDIVLPGDEEEEAGEDRGAGR